MWVAHQPLEESRGVVVSMKCSGQWHFLPQLLIFGFSCSTDVSHEEHRAWHGLKTKNNILMEFFLISTYSYPPLCHIRPSLAVIAMICYVRPGLGVVPLEHHFTAVLRPGLVVNNYQDSTIRMSKNICLIRDLRCIHLIFSVTYLVKLLYLRILCVKFCDWNEWMALTKSTL